MVKKSMCLLFAMAFCAAAVCCAQDAPSRNDSSEGNAAQRQLDAGQMNRMHGDHPIASTVRNAILQNHIVASLLLCNQSEIALNQLAIDKAKSDQVKQFAQMVMKQHETSVGQLRGMLPQVVVDRLRLSDIAQVAQNAIRRAGEGGEVQPYTTMRPVDEMTDTTVSQSITPLLDIDVRTAQNMVALTVAELAKQEGGDFDKAFIGQQIAAHTYGLARLRAIEPFVSGDLKQVIANQQKITIEQLNQAKQVMETLQKS